MFFCITFKEKKKGGLLTFVSFIPKKHTDVGVAVKQPNKLSEKSPSESNCSPNVPTTSLHHSPFPSCHSESTCHHYYTKVAAIHIYHLMYYAITGHDFPAYFCEKKKKDPCSRFTTSANINSQSLGKTQPQIILQLH